MLKIEKDVSLKKILPYLDKKALFRQRWGWKLPQEKYAAKFPHLESDLDRLLTALDPYLHLDYAIGSFEFGIAGNKVVFRSGQSLYFPRVKRKDEDFCIIDYVQEMEKKNLSLFMCTCGKESTDYLNSLMGTNQIDYFYTDGILSELAEAFAESLEQKIKQSQGYLKGKRYSPGVQSLRKIGERDYFPLENQKTIFSLLKADQIGLRLTETYMLIPEKSVSGIFVPSENARWL
jgi:5-methyltetrahydrofolate--homocysteine methyltransferase